MHIKYSIKGFIAAALSAHFSGPRPTLRRPSAKNLAASIDKVAASAVAAGESPGLQVAVFKDGRRYW